MKVVADGGDPEGRLFFPVDAVVVGGSEIPEGAIHEGNVGVGGEEAPLLHLAEDGAIDGAEHANGEVARDAVGILDQDHLKGGSDELAPVGVVVAPHRSVVAGGIGLLGGATKGAVPGFVPIEELFFENGFETLGGAGAIAFAVTHQEAERITAGLADHVLRTRIVAVFDGGVRSTNQVGLWVPRGVHGLHGSVEEFARVRVELCRRDVAGCGGLGNGE